MTVEARDPAIRLDKRRWVILTLLSIIGILVMIMSFFSGTVSEILKEQFDLKAEEVDWIFIANAAASVILGFPLGLVLRIYSLDVKKWLLTCLLVLICSYASMALSMLDKRVFFLAYIAQALCGLAFSLFVLLVGIAGISWFSEYEQATVFGVAYGSYSVGSLLSALIPVAFLTQSLDSNITDVVYIILRMYVGIGIFVIIILIPTWIFIPNLPPSPPSKLENIRRTTAVSEPRAELKTILRQYVKEWKCIMTDWYSQALLSAYSISISLLYLYFMMIPTLPVVPDSHNTLMSTSRKAYYLTCFGGGGAVAAVVFGLLQDKAKSYRPLAYTLAFSNLLFALIQNLAYFERYEACLYIFVGLQGATVSSSLAFTSEILKQTSYPKVSDGTQAIVISMICDAWFILYIFIFRGIISAFGDAYFYVITAICCFIEAVLLSCINPPLNRFVAEIERPLLDASE